MSGIAQGVWASLGLLITRSATAAHRRRTLVHRTSTGAAIGMEAIKEKLRRYEGAPAEPGNSFEAWKGQSCPHLCPCHATWICYLPQSMIADCLFQSGEAISKSLEGEFKRYLAGPLPLVLGVIENDAEVRENHLFV